MVKDKQWAAGTGIAMQEKQKVIVVGAGIFGLSAAVALLRRNFEVTVLEQNKIGTGASGGLVGALSPYVPEAWSVRKQFQLDALLGAAAYWQGVEALSGLSVGYGRIGRHIVLPNAYEAEKAISRVEGAARLWRGDASWDVLESTPMIDPVAAPFGVVYETLSGRINPRAACAALACCVEKLGGQVIENYDVRAVETGQVHGPDHVIKADQIIIAAGVEGLSLLEPYLGPKAVRGVKGQAAMLDVILPANTPLINGEGIYIIPHASHVSVGSTSETSWDDPYSTDHLLDEVLGKAIKICPRLRGVNISARWAGLRPRAPKPEPMLGALDKGVFVATGGLKTGLAVAYRVADALADLVEGNPPDIPLDFSPKHHFTRNKK